MPSGSTPDLYSLIPAFCAIARADCSLAEAIENIDIGGPTLVRAAAKNYQHVAVITDPADYDGILREMASANGAIGADTRFRLAQKAFSHTAAYDGAISNFLTATDGGNGHDQFSARLNLHYDLVQRLRYGENPHQDAAFYRDLSPAPGGIGSYVQHQGKELS